MAVDVRNSSSFSFQSRRFGGKFRLGLVVFMVLPVVVCFQPLPTIVVGRGSMSRRTTGSTTTSLSSTSSRFPPRCSTCTAMSGTVGNSDGNIQIYDNVLSSVTKGLTQLPVLQQQEEEEDDDDDDDEANQEVGTVSASSILHQIASDAGLSHKLLVRRSDERNKNKNTANDTSSSCSNHKHNHKHHHHSNYTTIGPQSLLEYALDQILIELNDTSKYVEYWCRQEWRHIEAHADVDEYRASAAATAAAADLTTTTTTQNRFRYPIHGHVLYLEIGNETRGPTCLFENITSGGELSSKQQSSTSSSSSLCPSSCVSLVTVPAVQDRLLRFPGNILHAVPRPTDIWLLPFVQGTPNYENVKRFGRSVVLFNTWSDDDDTDDSGPPMNVPQLEQPSSSSSSSSSTTLSWKGQMLKGKEEDAEDFMLVNPKTKWVNVDIHSSSSSSMPDTEKKSDSQSSSTYTPTSTTTTTTTTTTNATSSSSSSSLSFFKSYTKKTKIWLLGDLHRRQQELRTVHLYSNEDLLRTALQDPIQPQRTTLL